MNKYVMTLWGLSNNCKTENGTDVDKKTKHHNYTVDTTKISKQGFFSQYMYLLNMF